MDYSRHLASVDLLDDSPLVTLAATPIILLFDRREGQSWDRSTKNGPQLTTLTLPTNGTLYPGVARDSLRFYVLFSPPP